MKRKLLAALAGLALAITPATAALAASPEPGGRLLILNPTGPGQPRTNPYSVQPSGANRLDIPVTMAWYSNADYSPDGTKIVYAGGSAWAVEIINADGSGLRELTQNPYAPSFPRWSPDGDWIIYETGGNIWRVSDDGRDGGLNYVTGEGFPGNKLVAEWSPNSRTVAVAVWDDNPNIWLYPAAGDGSRSKRLTSKTGWFPYRMTWSPDGKTIVVESEGELFTVAVPSGKVRQLTNTPDVAEASPVYSPDGRWIAYESVGADGVPRVRIMDRNGVSRATGLTGTPTSWRAQP